MNQNWNSIITSDYKTALAIRRALENAEFDEAEIGINYLLESMSQEHKKALSSQLIRLIKHLIKWFSQPEKRTSSWAATIKNARYEILDIQELRPSLNRKYIESIWEKVFARAKDEAETEMEIDSKVENLTWEQVFEDKYEIPKK